MSLSIKNGTYFVKKSCPIVYSINQSFQFSNLSKSQPRNHLIVKQSLGEERFDVTQGVRATLTKPNREITIT